MIPPSTRIIILDNGISKTFLSITKKIGIIIIDTREEKIKRAPIPLFLKKLESRYLSTKLLILHKKGASMAIKNQFIVVFRFRVFCSSYYKITFYIRK